MVEVLSINTSANVFVFGDYNIHHKDWLANSGGTDRCGELCYNFSTSNDLTQGQVENSETSGTFFGLFLLRLFNFDPILKIENSKEENSEKKFRGF